MAGGRAASWPATRPEPDPAGRLNARAGRGHFRISSRGYRRPGPATRAYRLRVLDELAGARVARVRLDAVGYAVKTPGTSSMVLTWTDGAQVAELTADLAAGAGQVTWTEDGARRSAPLSGLPDLPAP